MSDISRGGLELTTFMISVTGILLGYYGIFFIEAGERVLFGMVYYEIVV